VVTGTLGGMLALGWRNGALKSRVVSLSQHEHPLDELAAAPAGGGRFDAVLMPLTLFDGWKRSHPQAPLEAAAWRKPIGVNLGFVTLAGDNAVRLALDDVITRARADGSLARWAAEEGVNWIAPETPEVGGGPGTFDLLRD
jgi:hypothetical protein